LESGKIVCLSGLFAVNLINLQGQNIRKLRHLIAVILVNFEN